MSPSIRLDLDMPSQHDFANFTSPILPASPQAIQKGVPLKTLLNAHTLAYLAFNLSLAYPAFDRQGFCEAAEQGLQSLELMQRSQHIARTLRRFLPPVYRDAIEILLASMTPAKQTTDDIGLAGFFYLPHSHFIAEFGLDFEYNQGQDPFELSMHALRELTCRFSAEFAIREFLLAQQERTLETLRLWLNDPNPHIRRLCSEGTRPRLPWGKRLPAVSACPELTLPLLEQLKDDASLYVRRSVANHLGDLAKDQPQIVFDVCERWLLQGATPEVKWLIRHAVRYHAKKEHPRALQLRQMAKGA